MTAELALFIKRPCAYVVLESIPTLRMQGHFVCKSDSLKRLE